MHRARQFLRKMAQPATTARSVPSPRPRETWGGPDETRAITCAQAETVSLDFEQLRRSNVYVASAATATAAITSHPLQATGQQLPDQPADQPERFAVEMDEAEAMEIAV